MYLHSEESGYENDSMIDELDVSFLDDPVMADVASKEAPQIVTGSRDSKCRVVARHIRGTAVV